MGSYKGMPLVAVRRWLREAGVEDRCLSALTPEDQALYRGLVATSWVPVESATRIYVAAAPLLFPGDPAPLRRVGRELAKDNFRGVLRYLMQLMSVEALLGKTALLWKVFHDQGEARASTTGERRAQLEVVGYPGLPERMRETICGWLAQAIEQTGAGNVSVTKSEGPDGRLLWVATWR